MKARQGKQKEAIAAWREAIRLRPYDAEAHIGLGLALQKLGQWKAAIAAYRQAIRVQPDLASAHANLGCALRVKGRLDEAIAASREAIRLQPELAVAHDNLGAALYALRVKQDGREIDTSEEEIAEFRAAIRLEPDLPSGHYNLGVSLCRKLGCIGEAVAAYREAIRIQPDFLEAHMELGWMYNFEGNDEAQAAEFREAIWLRPGYAEAHYGYGNAMRDLGRLEEAIEAYGKALRLEPNLAGAHMGLEKVKEMKRQPDDAADSYHARGNADLGREKPEAAIASFRAAIRLQPDHAAAHYDLAWCLGLCSEPSRRAQCEALARRGVELAPKKANSHRALALAEYRLGHWTESLAACEQSMALKRGGTAYEWFILALAHRQRGDDDESRTWFDKAVSWTRQRSATNLELGRLWSEAAALLREPGPDALDAGAPAAEGPP